MFGTDSQLAMDEKPSLPKSGCVSGLSLAKLGSSLFSCGVEYMVPDI